MGLIWSLFHCTTVSFVSQVAFNPCLRILDVHGRRVRLPSVAGKFGVLHSPRPHPYYPPTIHSRSIPSPHCHPSVHAPFSVPHSLLLLLKANHFFRTVITTMIPVLAMLFLVRRAKFIERKARKAVGKAMKKLTKRAESLYAWTLVVRVVSRTQYHTLTNYVPGSAA